MVAAELNEKVPRWSIDASTDLIGVRAEGKEMIQQFRLHGLTVGDMPYPRGSAPEREDFTGAVG